MHCLAERPKFFRIFFEEFLFWGASPGSAGCFQKPTQIPNAGHPTLGNYRDNSMMACVQVDFVQALLPEFSKKSNSCNISEKSKQTLY
jgi:hypothetical protein